MKSSTVCMIVKTNYKCRLLLKCDGTRAETGFRLSAKRTSPLKSAWASIQSTTNSQGVRISGSNAGYTIFRGSVKGTGYSLHSPVSPSLPLPCVTVCHHVSTGLYLDSKEPVLRLRYGLEYRAIVVRFPAGAPNFTLSKYGETGSGVQTDSNSIGTRSSYHGGKAADACN